MREYFFCTFGAACVAFFLCVPEPILAAGIRSAELIALTNADRAQNHLPALKINAALTLAAQEKADDMAAKGYFAHVSPDGRYPWYWFSLAGYDFRFTGEDLAVGFSSSSDVNAAWMISPLHRANILDQNYTETGAATSQGILYGRSVTFAVEEFASPR